MPATNYFKTLVFEYAINGIPFVIVGWSAALFQTEPVASGELIGEVAVSEYTRLAITFDSNYANTSQLTFPTATSTWGAIPYVAVTSPLTKGTGKVIGYQALGLGGTSVVSGNYVQISAGGLVLDLV